MYSIAKLFTACIRLYFIYKYKLLLNMSYMYGRACSIRKVLSVMLPLFLGEYAVAVS